MHPVSFLGAVEKGGMWTLCLREIIKGCKSNVRCKGCAVRSSFGKQLEQTGTGSPFVPRFLKFDEVGKRRQTTDLLECRLLLLSLRATVDREGRSTSGTAQVRAVKLWAVLCRVLTVPISDLHTSLWVLVFSIHKSSQYGSLNYFHKL
ncbi:hypothetical protein TNIN_399941 [Trichonephila inaurata madagascariensis]|uniref:Uncharacterized protein n=1 Tax=Trichonephila inaurata madagascariensis TaxID=2747483 RepID=A0A8X6XMM6_9ARAC|nr:hypothetical protein TNIN_399941 [Trichonephila inaurata madagascariensis]